MSSYNVKINESSNQLTKIRVLSEVQDLSLKQFLCLSSYVE